MLEKIVERAPLLVGEAVGIVVIAVLLSGVVVVVRRRTGAEAVALATTVRAGAFLVVAAWLLDNLSRMVVVVYPGIAWWTYALPIVVATVVLCVGADGSGAGARRRGEPRAVGTRRSWSSFVSPRLLWSALVAGGLLLATTIAAGLASSRDDVGRWAQLAFGNGAATSFYGWAYGVPVLIALALLVAIIGTRLRRIAAPPFPTALTLADERARRRRASDAVVTVGLCAVALSAGQVFAFLGRAGDAVVGAGIPGVGEFTWTTPYAGFAGAFEWGGWGLSVVAVAGLLTIGAGLLPGELRGRRISVRPRPAAPAR